ncbi:hypothetical protein JRO89_XS08G0248800 [Xanthoceras sorbifolium]|uniref:Uncharacterized protein n=1 Tax=Xanthoceras sorbifolium TaxID=99658 RepID=A0ABQ8HR86_9ROSI|nr:hypothetical protein JRO89_XS08G0248800 [Xanthoceras sorbifolium]
MEELRKLEQVQRTLLFMQSRGLLASSSSNNNNNDDDANRFLANLILLLVQPCGELDMDKKFSLISQHLPNISASFLEEASRWINEQGCHDTCIGSDILKESKSDYLQSNCEDMAMVGLDAMQLANSTLEDFCRSYFMFHGLDANSPQAIFKYLPVLSFTESYIYQLDRLNEKILNMPTSGVTVSQRGFEEFNRSQVVKLVDSFKSDPFRPLLYVLEQNGLLTERIREEFRCGAEYWTLERKLCCQLMSKKEISIENAMRAIQLKSFDYRVLNLLLYQLRREKVNELHMEFLSISEFLVEISDDLFDYEDDVLENNFNIYRMFIGIYGPSTAPAMLAKCITEAEEKYNSLLKSLDPQLSSNYQRRCEEATKEGGKVSGNPFGTWNMPPAIVNEESFRSNLLNSS